MRKKKQQGKSESHLWNVIYIAANRLMAERITEVLSQEGILAKFRPVGMAAEVSDGMHEILVLECEAPEAHSILCDKAIR